MKEEKEQVFLDSVTQLIDDTLKEQGDIYDREVTALNKNKQVHWDELSQMDDVDEAFSIHQIRKKEAELMERRKKAKKLKSVREMPYYGKIRIAFDDTDKEEYRIGYMTIDGKDGFPIVIDWRNDIAKLYYDAKTGKTSYTCPNGEIDCVLESRQQIDIEKGKVKRVVDTEIHVDDDFLQEVLAESSSGKMKDIVTSIQEEQNEVIRNMTDKTLIVEGRAGSGKTSVGLHRLAYLLYKDRYSTSNNMLIFSPSDVFSDYISNVLPALKENNVMQSTFKNFSESFLTGFERLESYTEFVARYYNGENNERTNQLNKFKFSNDFSKLLDEFIMKKADSYRFRKDFSYNGINIKVEKLNELLETEFKGYQLDEKIKRIVDYLRVARLDGKYDNEAWYNKFFRELVPSPSIRSIYNEFLASEEFKEASGYTDRISHGMVLPYPDLIAMLYIKFELFGYPENNRFRHVVIDEAQDYTPMQLKMIKKMLSGASFTILGDSDQTINPFYKYDSLEEMEKVLGPSKYIELKKAYRSSPEIMEYASRVTGKDIQAVRNSQNIPVVTKEVSREELFTTLVKDVLSLKENGFERVCIITKNLNEAKAIYDGLKDEIENITILSEDEQYSDSKTTISPVYISKGLEFDAVINYNSKENSYGEEDKYLYYVACTRAQHSLTVYNEPEKVMKRGVK